MWGKAAGKFCNFALLVAEEDSGFLLMAIHFSVGGMCEKGSKPLLLVIEL